MSVTDRRAAILDADDRAEDSLNEPLWGGDLLLLEPDATTRAELAELMLEVAAGTSELGLAQMYATVVVCTVCDPDSRERLFTMDDRDALLRKSGRVVERVAAAGLRIAGLNAGAVDEGKADSGGQELPTGSTTSSPST